ncbi:hypothetical protein BB559_006056, partial [Furculomyces boomerangus]
MHFETKGLIILGISILSVHGSPLNENDSSVDPSELSKRQSGFGGDYGMENYSGNNNIDDGSNNYIGINVNYGDNNYGGDYESGYFNNGRYWYWDRSPDRTFIAGLVYKPSVFYGQRFQYLYQFYPGFRIRWNSDRYFRKRWNSDYYFRIGWFNRVNYRKWRYVPHRRPFRSHKFYQGGYRYGYGGGHRDYHRDNRHGRNYDNEHRGGRGGEHGGGHSGWQKGE